MTNAQRKQTLHLARRLLDLADRAEALYPDRVEQVRERLGNTVKLAECLTNGFADPNDFSFYLLEGSDEIARRILAGEEVPLLVLEGEKS